MATPEIPITDSTGPWQVAHELIARAGELKLRSAYRMVSSYPIGKGDDKQAIFPAIAVPVQKKQAFECPEDHLAVLRASIGRATKLLIVGWRGNEQHCVELLRGLPGNEIDGMVVAGTGPAARDIATRLGLRVRWRFSSGGFSHFITSGEADQFLRE